MKAICDYSLLPIFYNFILIDVCLMEKFCIRHPSHRKEQ